MYIFAILLHPTLFETSVNFQPYILSIKVTGIMGVINFSGK